LNGKQQILQFLTQGERRVKAILELVHSDVCEPLWIVTLGGVKYFVTFIDDYSRFDRIYILKYKPQVLNFFSNIQSHGGKSN
jgi:hypothetical protein